MQAPHVGQQDDLELAANVVDIRRFSTHDGDGIRTTIFLKGCGLSCSWCQNPEAINARIRPVFFPSRCIDCGLCFDKARGNEVRRNASGRVHVDVTVQNADWQALADVCPTDAITFDAKRYTVGELVEIAQRDRVFFGQTGGVTLSGGEPLFMPHFAKALLRQLKAVGVHTAIETALHVRQEFLFEALPYLDQIFADCKVMDPETHLQYIGQDNARILANLQALLESNRRDDVIVRTPMIPGISNTVENIAAIARFISGIYPQVRYEILNYNPLAASKYDVVPDREFVFTKEENPEMFSAEEMDEFREIARNNGVTNLIIP